MAALSATNQPLKHVLGDLVIRHYDLSGNNGDTFTVPFPEQVLQVDITATTTVAVGATRNGGVITFAAGGAWAARITVWSRVG